MEDQEKQLRDNLDAERQEFLAVMSHELRTPMTGVKGYLSMILDGDAGEISQEVREYVAEAYVANDRLIRLVERMMKVVSIQEGKIKLQLNEVELTEQVEILIHDFKIPAQDKGLELVYNKPENKVFVYADPDRLREVIMNLISNAVKFTPSPNNQQNIGNDKNDDNLVRGFTNQGRIEVSHRNLEGFEVVDITDSGIGISIESQAKLFQIFNKANLALAGQEKGTGLGLFLSKKLAEAQGGKVWLEKSEEGKGSTFCAAFKKVKLSPQ